MLLLIELVDLIQEPLVSIPEAPEVLERGVVAKVVRLPQRNSRLSGVSILHEARELLVVIRILPGVRDTREGVTSG